MNDYKELDDHDLYQNLREVGQYIKGYWVGPVWYEDFEMDGIEFSVVLNVDNQLITILRGDYDGD